VIDIGYLRLGGVHVCGVVAELRFDGMAPSRGIHERQLETLRHRGPDAHGYSIIGSAAIGQTRLRVIDTVHGDPPIKTPSGRFTVSLNGEIYNYRELREELRRHDYKFSSGTDTEVVAHLLEIHGPLEAAKMLDGMFAIAAWDDRDQQLILIRDHLGEKPLFFALTTKSIVVSSEIKALLLHPDVSNQVDLSMIPDYLSCGYVPSPNTFFTHIKSLPAGSVMQAQTDGQHSVETYWSLPMRNVLTGSVAELALATRQHIEQAVKTRSSADRRLGCFLSGGIDSSIVAAALVTASPTQVETFTVGFDDIEFDERKYASMVAQRLGTNHHEIVVAPNIVELTQEISLQHDQPFADSSSVPFYILSQYAAQQVTVALSGDGGDEIFGGYERFSGGLAVATAQAHPKAWALALAGSKALHFPSRVLRNAAAVEAGLPTAFRQWISYTSDPDVLALTYGKVPKIWGEYLKVWESAKGDSVLDRLMRINLDTYLLDDLLVKADRMSMAHGLEVRNPFLATDLVEFTFQLPDKTKTTIGQRKRILKAAYQEILPTEVLKRRKHGFGIPLDNWFRGDLGVFAAGQLGAGAKVREVLNPQAIENLLIDHKSGRRNLGHTLWTLLMLELFLRRHADHWESADA